MTYVRNQQRTQTNQQKPEKKASANKLPLIIGIIILLIAVIVGSYFLYPVISERFGTNTPETPAPIVEEQPIVTEEQPTEKLQPLKTESSSSVPKGFYIIVGSYKIKSNAENMIKKCSKDIHLEVLYFNEIGFHRVSAGRYDNIHKAYNDIYSIRDLDGCTNAWVLENQ